VSAICIRDAREGDEDAILKFLRDFAAFEKLTHTFRLTREIIARDFLGPDRRVQCDLAEWNGAPAGLMIWFRQYSTFQAAPVFYLEDIYVAPDYRRRGVATALLQHLSARAREENAVRLDWIVLEWNAPAIAFYERMGARLAEDWRVCRLETK
jgi:GNAT superfamily N-acetyltransferase